LNLTAIELEETLSFSLEYCTKLFKKETVERFIKYFKRLTASVIANPDQPLSEPEILPEEEKAGILRMSTGEIETVDNPRTIQRMFEETVEKGPGKTALVLGENQLTYEELNQKANQLAWCG
jgi:non-ribosomal peptide synthetase component F